MSELRLELVDHDGAFRPGDRVPVLASWERPERPKRVALHLFWYTDGKGTRDVEIVDERVFDDPPPVDARAAELVIPLAGPISLTGGLVSLRWAVEIVVEPGGKGERIEIEVGPEGAAMRLDDAPQAIVERG